MEDGRRFGAGGLALGVQGVAGLACDDRLSELLVALHELHLGTGDEGFTLGHDAGNAVCGERGRWLGW